MPNSTVHSMTVKAYTLELKNIDSTRDHTTSYASDRHPEIPNAQKTSRSPGDREGDAEVTSCPLASPPSSTRPFVPCTVTGATACSGSSLLAGPWPLSPIPHPLSPASRHAASSAATPTSRLIAAATLVVERMPRLPTRKKPAVPAPTIAPNVLTA